MDIKEFISKFPVSPRMKDLLKIIYTDVDNELILGIIAKMSIGGLNENVLAQIRSLQSELDDEVRINREENLFFNLLGETDSFFEAAKFLRLVDLIDEIGLTEISTAEWVRIHRRASVILDQEEPSMCWYPNCQETSIIKAHSIQKNRWLINIADKTTNQVWHLPMYRKAKKNEIDVQTIFKGFCEFHDKITFKAIEDIPYVGSEEQNFLMAYRAFTHTSHMLYKYEKVREVRKDYEREITLNRNVFDSAILSNTPHVVITQVLTLKRYYPIAAAGAFHLYCDFYGRPINHDFDRLAKIYLTVIPDSSNYQTKVLFSYFDRDADKYGEILNQIFLRGNIEQDLSTLIVGLMQNVFFSPNYYTQVVAPQSYRCFELLKHMPRDYIPLGYKDANTYVDLSYLSRNYGVNLMAELNSFL